MPPLLTGAMLGSTALAACCALAEPGRSGRGRMRASAVVMLAAMVDVSVVGALLPLVWAIAMVVTGVGAVAADRWSAHRTDAAVLVHRGLSSIVMGALVLGHPGSAHGGHAHGGLALGVVVMGLGAAVIGGGLVLTGRHLVSTARAAARDRVAALEPALMSVAVATMLLAG